MPAVIGFALCGLGIANAVPLLFSAAGRHDPPGPSLAATFTVGYTGFIVGPPVIGFLADRDRAAADAVAARRRRARGRRARRPGDPRRIHLTRSGAPSSFGTWRTTGVAFLLTDWAGVGVLLFGVAVIFVDHCPRAFREQQHGKRAWQAGAVVVGAVGAAVALGWSP